MVFQEVHRNSFLAEAGERVFGSFLRIFGSVISVVSADRLPCASRSAGPAGAVESGLEHGGGDSTRLDPPADTLQPDSRSRTV
ncbi:hypothetical protein GCM10027360_64910 [Amycolatopsis echigonensis]